MINNLLQEYIDCSYDKELFEKIDFLKLHESYLPYVGKEYRNAKFKILHVANCHYIELSQDPDNRYDFTFYRDNWFSKKIPVFPEIYDLDRQMSKCRLKNWREKGLTCKNAWNEYCLNTRNVVVEQLSGQRNPYNLVGTSGYKLYKNVIKVLSATVGKYFFGENRDIEQINKCPSNDKKWKAFQSNIEAYRYVAFTDFHVIPAIMHGESRVLDSLVKAAKKKSLPNPKEEAEDFYRKIVIESSMYLDKIIEILKPDMVFISSVDAGRTYINNSQLTDYCKIFCSSHPNWWNSNPISLINWNRETKTWMESSIKDMKELKEKFSEKVETLRKASKN